MNQQIYNIQLQESQKDILINLQHSWLLFIMREYNKTLHLQELLWKQKSRVTWLKDGNVNTKYFHRSTILRRRKNKISYVKNNQGVQVEDMHGIINQLVSHFQYR